MVVVKEVWRRNINICYKFLKQVINKIKENHERRKKEVSRRRYIYYEKKYTVACDKSPFWYSGNEREFLFKVFGLKEARRIGSDWVRRYDYGQAIIIEGWHCWEGKNGSKS